MRDSHDGRLEQVRATVRGCGMRWTSGRAAIVGLLLEADAHLPADAICTQVAQRLPGLDRSGVPRTLNALVDRGIVHVVNGTGEPRYGVHQPAHHHVACRCCDAVIDLPADRLADDLAPALRTAARVSGYRLDPDRVTLTGLCPACAPDGPRAGDRP